MAGVVKLEDAPQGRSTGYLIRVDDEHSVDGENSVDGGRYRGCGGRKQWQDRMRALSWKTLKFEDALEASERMLLLRGVPESCKYGCKELMMVRQERDLRCSDWGEEPVILARLHL